MEGVKKGMIKPIKVNTGIMNLEDYDNEEPLSPSSVIFHEPSFNVHILAILGYKTILDLEEYWKSRVPNTLLKHPRFSSIVVGDSSKGEELKWVRTKVDLDNHIIVPKIDLENIESPQKYLEDYLYNLSKTTLNKSRPLWDIHILHLKLSEDVMGVGILRTHHSLGDGTSLLSLLLAISRKNSDPTALPTIPVQKTYVDDDKNRKWFIWRWILSLWWMLQFSWNTMIGVLMFVATLIFLKDKSPLKSSPRASANTSRRFVYKSFSLDDMKLVKNAIGGTINDVALGITQAGLSHYLNRKYGINGDDHIRLRSMLLINLRPSGGMQALADMMDKDTEAKWGNSFGYVLLPFTIGLRDDPLDYIREAKATIDRKKNSLEVLFTHFITEIVEKLFGAKAACALFDKINSHTTIAFSNLPGPVEEIDLYGHPLAFLAPTSYGQPHELMINFQSYINKMTLALAVDEDAIPDPHQLCDDIVDSLKLVKDAVIANGCSTTEQ